jgi:hypothetical protein
LAQFELFQRRVVELGRPRRVWEDNIKMDLRVIEWDVLDWIHLSLDRDRCRSVVKFIVP